MDLQTIFDANMLINLIAVSGASGWESFGLIEGRDENVSKMDVDGRRPSTRTSTGRKPQSG